MPMILEPLPTRPAGDQSRMTLRCQLCNFSQEGIWNDLAASGWHACDSIIHGTAYVCIGCLTSSTHRRFRGRNIRREQTTIVPPERDYDPRTPALEPRRALLRRRWFRGLRSWPPTPAFEIVMVLLAILGVLLLLIVLALSFATILDYGQRRATPRPPEAAPTLSVPDRRPGWQPPQLRREEPGRLKAAAHHPVQAGAHIQGLPPIAGPKPAPDASPPCWDGSDTRLPCTRPAICPPCQHPSASRALACAWPP